MKRLIVLVEGQAEETFVNELLGPHLYPFGFSMVSARLLGNARQRAKRGGIKAWSSVRKDIIHHLKQDPGVVLTTMVDFYALLASDNRGWPGRREASTKRFEDKASTVELALLDDLAPELEAVGGPSRFIPNVVMHEFEGLLFSDCSQFAESLGKPELANEFQAIRDQFNSPEEINDSPTTAPSKRVLGLVESYRKPLFGNVAMLDIGLEQIRGECPHFHDWLTRLESLPAK